MVRCGKGDGERRAVTGGRRSCARRRLLLWKGEELLSLVPVSVAEPGIAAIRSPGEGRNDFGDRSDGTITTIISRKDLGYAGAVAIAISPAELALIWTLAARCQRILISTDQ